MVWGYIYKITCPTEGNKVYIGSTMKEPEARFKQHSTSPVSKMKHLKGMHETLNFEVLEYGFFCCHDHMLMREDELILKHDSIQNGYNSKINKPYGGGCYSSDDEE